MLYVVCTLRKVVELELNGVTEYHLLKWVWPKGKFGLIDCMSSPLFPVTVEDPV